MAEPTLEFPQSLMQRLLDGQREMREDVREIKVRLGRIETTLAGMQENLAEHSVRMDRIVQRVERIETRLDLRDS